MTSRTMPITKTLHIGTVLIGKETVYAVHRGTRHSCLSDLNDWIFDYCRANAKILIQLPPMDDWQRSLEDASVWSFFIEYLEIMVILQSESIEFQ